MAVEVFSFYTLTSSIAIATSGMVPGQRRYPYSHDTELILNNFRDFSQADSDFDSICLLGKYWEFIKDDIQKIILEYRV